MLVDEMLFEHDPVFAESGDRAAVLALSGEASRELMGSARLGRYGRPG